MRKATLLGCLFLTLALLFAAAPLAWAGTAFGGYWAGTWNCTPPPCQSHSGGMYVQFSHQGNQLGGEIVLRNTDSGDVYGILQNASLQNGSFTGTVLWGQAISGTSISGQVNGDVLEGSFSDPAMGKYAFTLKRESERQ